MGHRRIVTSKKPGPLHVEPKASREKLHVTEVVDTRKRRGKKPKTE